MTSAVYLPATAQAQIAGAVGGVGAGLIACNMGSILSGIGSAVGIGGGSGGSGSVGSIIGGNAVPVSDATVRSNTTAVKDDVCTWKGLAWQAAQVILHQLTNSVVTWINTGFKGEPAFLKNPEGFFMDAADQVTGAFISDLGPLGKSLCSPFNIDLRLSLALGQTSTLNQRYTCTLSKVIQTAKQSGNVSVSVKGSSNGTNLGDIMSGNVLNNPNDISINGASVDGFMGGDFRQGGWPAFMALVSEPQNNAFGAALQAKSDLDVQIQKKQNAINNDLNRGNGFLSWQKCDNVQTSSGSTATTKVCHVETPGSVISAALNKQLGAQTDTLNMTHDINEIATALTNQLFNQVLSNGGGLLSLTKTTSSNSSSGSNAASQSFINQYANSDPALQTNFTNLKQQTVAPINTAVASVQQSVTTLNSALTLIKQQQTAYAAASACLQTRASASGAAASLQTSLTALNNVISITVTPAVNQYQSAYNSTQSVLLAIQSAVSQMQSATTAQQLTDQQNSLNNLIAQSTTAVLDPQVAQTYLTTATQTATTLQTTLAPYQALCTSGTATPTAAP